MKGDSNPRGKKLLLRAVIWALCLIPLIIFLAEQNWKVGIPFMFLAFVVFLLVESYLKDRWK
jgi:hypothetical protein